MSASDPEQAENENVDDPELQAEIEDAEELADEYEHAHEDVTTEREAFELELMERGESEAGEFVHVLDEE